MPTRFTILGSGSSLGIPRIDGYFGKCNPKIKENYRSRCSALISKDKFNILIDSSPDLKSQLLKKKFLILIRFFIRTYMEIKHMELMSCVFFF